MKSLVLSGGGVRGFAHAGVIGVIGDHIEFDEIVGCSMGALVGALYGATKDPKKMMDYILHVKAWELFYPSFSKQGFIKGDKMIHKILEYGSVKKFSDLQIPLKVNATNLKTGEEAVFEDGRLDKALLATSAYPGVFVPVKYKNTLFTDGGITEPFPIKYASHHKVVGVNVSYGLGLPKDFTSTDVLKQCINVLQKRLAESQISNKKAVIIRPEVSGIGAFDARKKNQCIKAGVKAAKALSLAKLK